jgi:antitoxin (DNA-binding transcriptional repressor) of toxin-antitoxin stability system
MSRKVTVEELAANLQEHLEEVKRGETLTLVEEDKEIAEIHPRPIKILRHDPALRLQDFEPGPRPTRLEFDAVQWLIDERERERSGKKYGA